MKSNGVLLAVEDNLSNAVATKILQKLGFVIVKRIGYSGYGYLKTKAKGLNQNARKPYDVFILTDLDSPNICPPELIQSWIRGPLNIGESLRNGRMLFQAASLMCSGSSWGSSVF